MSTVGSNFLTLADWAKRLDPEGKVPAIVELLGQTNEMLEDIPWVEGNLPTGHKTTVRSGLPTVTWRQLNYGVQPSKSLTVPVTDTCGMLEAYAEVDKSLADLNGNTAEFRLSEDQAFLEAMNQESMGAWIYGNSAVDPAKIMGFAPRFNSLSAGNGANIISGGGSGNNNTSIWVVVWSPQTVHGIFPKGSKAGIQHTDLGEQTLTDAAGGKYQGYRTHYKWDQGLTVRDWRYVSRIANIDVTALVKNAATGADLNDLMVQALEAVNNLKVGKAAIYCNKTIRTWWRRQLINKANVHLTFDTVGGKRVLAFDEVPVRRVDQILNTESPVAA